MSDDQTRPSPQPAAREPHPGHQPDGRFARGHTLTLKHGAFSKQVRALLPEQAEILATLAEQRQAIDSDLGGPDAVGALSRDLVSRYLELSVIADYLGRQLVTTGPLTVKGAQRARSRRISASSTACIDLRWRSVLSAGRSRSIRWRRFVVPWRMRISGERSLPGSRRTFGSSTHRRPWCGQEPNCGAARVLLRVARVSSRARRVDLHQERCRSSRIAGKSAADAHVFCDPPLRQEPVGDTDATNLSNS
jgi:hypothetical protein